MTKLEDLLPKKPSEMSTEELVEHLRLIRQTRTPKARKPKAVDLDKIAEGMTDDEKQELLDLLEGGEDEGTNSQ